MGYALSGGGSRTEPAALTVFNYYSHNCLPTQSTAPGHPQLSHTLNKHSQRDKPYVQIHTQIHSFMHLFIHHWLSFLCSVGIHMQTIPHTQPSQVWPTEQQNSRKCTFISFTPIWLACEALCSLGTPRDEAIVEVSQAYCTAAALGWTKIRKLCCTYWYNTEVTQPVSFWPLKQKVLTGGKNPPLAYTDLRQQHYLFGITEEKKLRTVTRDKELHQKWN